MKKSLINDLWADDSAELLELPAYPFQVFRYGIMGLVLLALGYFPSHTPQIANGRGTTRRKRIRFFGNESMAKAVGVGRKKRPIIDDFHQGSHDRFSERVTHMLSNPVLIPGDAVRAYRDPAAVIEGGVCHLFFTCVDNRPGGPWLFLAEKRSRDLENWSDIRILTPRDKSLNFSSPGNIVRDGDDWVICFQTYCRENGEKYGNSRCRLYTMRSPDLNAWSEPELLRVKGNDVKPQDMGRMIDPYLLRAGNEWWCFYKQNGVSFSKSPDLITWTYMGHAQAGENACVVAYNGGYRMFSSPENGIRVMDSRDLVNWRQSMDDLTLGQAGWDWAKGRLTAGFVMENEKGFGDLPHWIMFFHASRYPETINFDSYASIALAYSDDLITWRWPGKS